MNRLLLLILLVTITALPVTGCNSSLEEAAPTIEATWTPTPTPTPTNTPTATPTPTPTVLPTLRPVGTPTYKLPEFNAIECYSEDVILGQLLESSEEFRAFYEVERWKITAPICWTSSITLPEWLEAISSISLSIELLPHSYDNLFINLKRIPISMDDDFVIAHELRLFSKMVNEGFPIVVVKPYFCLELIISETCEPPREGAFAFMLSDMFAALICDAGLEFYGFNLMDNYKKQITLAAIMLEELKNNSRYDNPDYQALFATFATVKSILYLEDILKKSDKDQNELQEWIEANELNISDQVVGLLPLIREIGYDNPQKMETLLTEILERYNLSSSLQIYYLPKS